MSDLAIGCRCGAVRGILRDVSPASATHLVCYCRDCRAFARYLHRDRDILDPAGGTAILQIASDRIEIPRGHRHLACLTLKRRGLLRWYTLCCNTPVANTLRSRALPFAGMIVPVIRSADPEALGPVVARTFTGSALAEIDGARGSVADVGWKLMRRMIAARGRGAHRRSPFFRPDGTPLRPPHVLGADERRAAYGEAG